MKPLKVAGAALALALTTTAVSPAAPAEAYVDYYQATYVCKYWTAPQTYVLQLQRWQVRDYSMLEEWFGYRDTRTLIGTQWTSTLCRNI